MQKLQRKHKAFVCAEVGYDAGARPPAKAMVRKQQAIDPYSAAEQWYTCQPARGLYPPPLEGLLGFTS